MARPWRIEFAGALYHILSRGNQSGKIVMELHGRILKGGFSLVQMKARGEKNWLLIKKKTAIAKINGLFKRR